MFEKYWEEKAAYDNAHKPEMVKIVPSKSPIFNKNILLASIYDIDYMSDADLQKFVQNSFKLILNNIFFGSPNSIDYIRCFTNVRFLDAFIYVIENMARSKLLFEKDDIVKINNICYDYITVDNKDMSIVNRMLRIASIINNAYLPRLLGLGLSNNLANMILIARYSTINLNVCVRRVNFIIITQPKEIMTKEVIANIFRYIYSIETEFYQIFPYIMMDVLPEYDEERSSTHWITDEIQEVDSELSLAVLDILQDESGYYSMTTQRLRQILVNYAEGYALVHNGKAIRFSMRRLSDDYSRINDMVDTLAKNEGIMVP